MLKNKCIPSQKNKKHCSIQIDLCIINILLVVKNNYEQKISNFIDNITIFTDKPINDNYCQQLHPNDKQRYNIRR